MRRTAGLVRFLFLAFGVLTPIDNASAQAYPIKPVRMILPFPSGAASDIVGRILGTRLGEQMGQNFIPDNRVGAGGNVGLVAAAKALPDGYTVLVSSPAIALGPLLYPDVQFDAVRDFQPVARVGTIDNVMLVHPSVPAKTLKEFIELARKSPGRLSFGSGGAGTTNHLANELLMYTQKLSMLHVPYKGAALATVALMSGEVDEVVIGVAPAMPMIKSGKVKPLVVLSEARVPLLPDVPTSTEAGVPDLRMSIWYGIFVPIDTPKQITARLTRETLKALESADLRERMLTAGITPWPGPPEALTDLLRSETARYRTAIQAAKIKLR